ncbi:rap1 GTPase-GDP dissociation stimulator 1-like isoform X2 [Motacilla alba alba]|uniref:rap1 GTPase-GDP dissociation stimulator 1-like isoform X2 n=1 Tax=Motacilla alba alba TaxID=1094192 RepID=UPI0018D56A9C|nr:rap1 GTPase-GDP dissociation stimulator 1-like isoform X2 [Motacilla alba alba]
METLNKHLEYLGVCGDDTDAEDQILESLNGILLAITEDKQRSFHLLRGSGIFPTLAKVLKGNPRCAVKAAHVLSEIAKNEEMKKPCIEADLVPTLIPLLESTDQEMLLHAGRAIGRICYDNRSLQEELVKVGVIPSLVRILTDYAESEPLVHVALLALYNLADLDALKVQLVDAGVPEVLSEILLRLQGSSQAEDTCIVKAASDLIVSLLLGDGNCLRLFQLGVIHQLLDLLEKHVQSGDTSVQQAALSALQSLAVPVVSKVQMLEEGVAERIEALLRSESPPVQFKLLGTLRTLADGQADAAEILGQDPLLLNRLVQWCSESDHSGICGEANRLLASILHHNRSQEVVKAIQAAQGVKHLVSMTTSEHVAMQNEALNALAIASAIDLETLEESFKESQLVQSLHKLLRDDNTSPEVKYNSMSLLCRLLNSGDLRQEIEEDKIKDTLEQLCSHSNADVVKEAITTLQVLRGETPH